MRVWSPRRRGKDLEDGVVAVVVALVVCLLLVPLAALTVDIGVQRVARSDMQSVADVVALDTARLIDGRTAAQLLPSVQAAALSSAARNKPGATISVQLGTVATADYQPTAPLSAFKPVTGTQVPNAVMVTARTTVQFAMHPGSGAAVRSSVAVSDATACFKIGSYALRLNSSSSALLNLLVGDALGVGVLTYTGLANASISLLGLATELGVATPAELAGLNNLSLGRLYLAMAHVLTQEHGDTANIALLNKLAQLNLGSLPPINLGKLLALQDAPAAALSTSVNLLDLVAGSALLANGTNALAVPNLTVGIPGLAGVTAALKIVQAPVMTCGPVGTSQHTAQVTLHVEIGVPGLDLIGLLGLGAKITLNVELAEGTVTLDQVSCGGAVAEGIGVSVASSLAQLDVGLFAQLKALGLSLVDIAGNVGTTAAPTRTHLQINVPPGSYDTPVSSGSGLVLTSLKVDNLQTTLLGSLPLGLGLGWVLESVVNLVVVPVLNPVLALVNQLVLGPISDLLGLNVAGVDVFAVPKPSCSSPALRG